MISSVNTTHLKLLMYYLGARQVAAFLGANSERELLAWIDHSKAPTKEQVSRLEHAHTEFERIHNGEGPIAALTWFASHDIDELILEGQFQTVKESATNYMMPND